MTLASMIRKYEPRKVPLTADGATADHVGDDRFAGGRGLRHCPSTFRARPARLRKEGRTGRRHHSGPRQVHGPACLCAGDARALLSDGHGRTVADVGRRWAGARGLHTLRHDLCGVRLAPRLRFYRHGDRGRESPSQHRLCTSGPQHRLWAKPSGNRRPGHLPRIAEHDDHRSLRC